MRYGSVCSGIEAASVAWKPLGWTPVFFAENDGFPSAVLAHRYPHVPNWGDITRYKEWPDATLDLLVGGTPCQSFSVAGLRKGLADPRGNLALTFLGIADRYRPEWLIWENVPGVLSQDEGRAFGSILGGMAELGYHVAYRVLDAQYCRVDGFGRAVPQRRRRVFVVGHSGDWRRAAAVLFEPESLSGNNPPRRQAGKGAAGTVKRRLERCSADEAECGTLIAAEVTPPLDANYGKLHGQDHQSANTGHAQLVAFGGNNTEGPITVATAVRAKGGTGHGDFESETFIAFDCKASATRGVAARQDVSSTLRGMTESDDGKANGGGQVAIAFSHAQITSPDNRSDVGPGKPCPTLAKGWQPMAIAIQERAVCENPDAGPDGAGVRDDGSIYTLEARQQPQAVAFKASHYTRGKDGGLTGTSGEPNDVFPPLSADADKGDQDPLALIGHNSRGWAVRRLTPVECERLQGFQDGYTDIPRRGKAHAPDGPRYKALGNSMAVNCMRWLGRRIEAVEAIANPVRDAAE